MENKVDKKVVNILPLQIGKRIAVFFADFFLNFILSFVFINIMVMPIGKVMTNFSSKNDGYMVSLNNRADILYGNKLLFNSGDVDKSEIVYNTSFTFRCYLSYFAFDSENPSNVSYKQYGHKEDNNIFKHYFVDICGKSETYVSLFDLYNKENGYFEMDDDLSVSLKEDIKQEIVPFFIKEDSVSTLGKKYIDNIEKNFFTPLNCEIYESIEENDLLFNGISYNQNQVHIKEFEKYFNDLVTYVAFITVFISSFVLYFIVPICNRNRRTISMMILKIERVNIYKLTRIKKYDVFMSFVYQFLLSFAIATLIPIGYLSFVELFEIPVLFIFAIFSILLSLGSFIFALINGFNRTMFDYFTRTVYIPKSELDDIYKAKGYNV